LKDTVKKCCSKLETKLQLKKLQEEIAERIKGAPRLRTTILVHFSIIVAIGIIIFRNFLFSDAWPAGGDALGIVSRVYIFGRDLRWLYVWRPHSFGFVEVIHAYDFFLMILNWIFIDPIATTKVFLFLTFIVSGFSSYTLTYWYTKNTTASLAASLVYVLNRWLFSQYTEAHGDILFSYALAPFIYLSLFRALETPKPKRILVAGLALGLFVSAFHPECVVIYGASFPIFALTYILIPRRNSTRLNQLKNLLKTSLPLALLCFTLAAFLFIPMIFSVQPRYYSSTYKYFIEESYGGVYRNLTDAFTLGAVEVWGYVKVVDVTSELAMPDFPIESLSLLVFGLAYCTVFIKRDKYTVFFLISTIVATFIAKGSSPPFGYLYLWAWWNVPYFAVFRAANRWIMMSILSHAFLVAVLVDILTKYVRSRKFSVVNEAFSSVNAKASRILERLAIPLKVTRNHFVHFHRVLHYASILLLAAIFLNGFLSTWFFLKNGLYVYKLPEGSIKPYDWLASQSGDFKVISINRGPGRWRNEPTSGFDFGFGGMLTEVGWAHDIGFESAFIHDKPVMQDGGWDPNAHDFADYLRFRLAGQQKTRDFLRLTGLFNYRYVVLPAYLDTDIRSFFLSQTGAAGHVVYDDNQSMVIENPFYTPRFFGLSEHVNVLGGLGSFPSIAKIGVTNLNEAAIFFADRSNGELFNLLQNDAEALVFVNANLLDLTMLQLNSKAKIISAADFAVNSLNVAKYWVPTTSWRDVGALVYGGKTLTTSGNVSIDIPFEVSTEGSYDVWVRVGYLSYRGKLSILVDSVLAGELKPEADYWCGLVWVKLLNVNMAKGSHKVTLINDGSGYNDVDAVAIIEHDTFESTYGSLLQSLESFKGRLIDVLGAASTFAYKLPTGWSIQYRQYEDDLLEAENTLVPIQESTNASASSVQDEYVPQNAVDGLSDTRWASDPEQPTPQWLQAEWSTPHEMAGVQILFETALAKNYTVQTWDGTQWITQINITDNTLLSRFHVFREPVTTNKMLINVTAYGSKHNMVSILDVKPCASSSIVANHFIIKSGSYMAALRLGSGPNYGVLNLRIGDYLQSLDCYSSEEEFQWYEVGPLNLEQGLVNISLTAQGNILFDQMLLASSTESEETNFPQYLFSSNSVSPTISYTTENPTSYRVHIKTEQPFFLVFSESYHPLWTAKLDNGQEIQSANAYYFVNSFYINRTGEFDVQVYFEGQAYADLGLRLSLSGLIIIAVILLMPRRVIAWARKRLTLRKGD
jgi:hypothetical protein